MQDAAREKSPAILHFMGKSDRDRYELLFPCKGKILLKNSI